MKYFHNMETKHIMKIWNEDIKPIVNSGRDRKKLLKQTHEICIEHLGKYNKFISII